jgi:hypothetical protein
MRDAMQWTPASSRPSVLVNRGKSQLVLAYVREYREDYSTIFWVEAGQKESIEREYLQIH